jgi:hypothetical protein
VVLVAVQVSLMGLYLPPVLKELPPQMIISLPVQTAVCSCRAVGALAVLVAVQPPANLPPVFKAPLFPLPPQTIIALPVHTAVCCCRASGALVVGMADQVSLLGKYIPPVFVSPGEGKPSNPPQTIISLPVQTAV